MPRRAAPGPRGVGRLGGAPSRLLRRCTSLASEFWSDVVRRRDSGQCTARDRLLATAVLPFEPQPLGRWRSQWFEGWFFRFIDHAAGVSVAVILGSMRLPGRSASAPGAFDEHLLVLAFRDANGYHRTVHTILGEHDAQLLGGGAGQLPSSMADSPPPKWEWRSTSHGFIRGAGDAVELDVNVDAARLIANVSAPRVVWSEASPDREGPEGWLGRTGLLPCHYFVHSFASPASYALSFPVRHKVGGSPSANRAFAHSSGTANLTRLQGHELIGFRGRILRTMRVPLRLGRHAESSRLEHLKALSGHASTHIERNYGDAFPRGWVWAQASAPAPRAAQMVLTGGRFVIGPVETESFVIALRATAGATTHGLRNQSKTTPTGRTPMALTWNFRTTDGDDIRHERFPCEGVLRLNATSRDGKRRLFVRIRAPPKTFGARIPVPTAEGFMDSPGCRESYNATADLVAFARTSRWSGPWGGVAAQVALTVPMAVLEFGGIYQC